MNRRNKKKSKRRGNNSNQILLLLLFTLPAMVATWAALGSNGTFWQEFTREAAVASALYNMPVRSLDLLEKRFNSEIFTEEEESKQEIIVPVTPPEKTISWSDAQEIASSSVETPVPGLSLGVVAKPMPIKDIPEKYRANILEEDLSISAKADPVAAGGYVSAFSGEKKGKAEGTGFIKNSTSLGDDEVKKILESVEQIEISEKGPQVLIMHTHATESFEEQDATIYDTRNTWRTTDNTKNIVAVGEAVAEAIRVHGIEVLHDETQHDYPSYNGSYERSEVTVKEYLEKYPTISVVLDVHRDAVQRDTTLVKPVSVIDGKKTAQLMIIAGCDDGSMNMPNWSKNLKFAADLQNAMESKYPTLTRPVFFCYRRYNQQLTTGSLLIEFGSHGNTLEEVINAGNLAGDAIGEFLAGRLAGE